MPGLPISDISHPEVIRFLSESYEKTTRLTMKWNIVHGARMKEAATLQREEKGYYESDVVTADVASGMSTLNRDHINGTQLKKRKPIRDGVFIPGAAHLRKGHTLTAIGLGDEKDDPRLSRADTDLTPDPVMRPIDPVQRDIVNKDIPVYGRKVYLKSRLLISPEKRYYLPVSCGWDYGWRLKDSYFGHHQPKFGRVWRLTHGVKSRTGPQPDPLYYKSPEEPGVSKCVAF